MPPPRAPLLLNEAIAQVGGVLLCELTSDAINFATRPALERLFSAMSPQRQIYAEFCR